MMILDNQDLQSNKYFEIASISKTIFSFIVYKLTKDKIVKCDDYIYLHLPNYILSSNLFYKKITIGMVLNHSSGLSNWDKHRDKKINFEPGTAFMYSGEGYCYLQKAIENVTKLNFQELIDKYINNIIHTKIYSNFNNVVKENIILPNTEHYEGIKFENVAYSCYATYSDLQKFLKFCFLESEFVKWAINNQVKVIDNVSWCSGFGLVNQRTAFQYGDNGDYKSLFVINLKDKILNLALCNYSRGLMDSIRCFKNQDDISIIEKYLKFEYQEDFINL